MMTTPAMQGMVKRRNVGGHGGDGGDYRRVCVGRCRTATAAAVCVGPVMVAIIAVCVGRCRTGFRQQDGHGCRRAR